MRRRSPTPRWRTALVESWVPGAPVIWNVTFRGPRRTDARALAVDGFALAQAVATSDRARLRLTPLGLRIDGLAVEWLIVDWRFS